MNESLSFLFVLAGISILTTGFFPVGVTMFMLQNYFLSDLRSGKC